MHAHVTWWKAETVGVDFLNCLTYTGAGDGCNNTVTIPIITAKKIVPFLEVLEGLNTVLAKTYSTIQTSSCILNSISSEKQ